MSRLLIVDDSQSQLVAIRALLNEEPYELETADDGQIALDMIAKRAPDIVVTDMLMPNVNGLDLIKQLRRTSPQIPVILISAKGSEELSVEALRVGATAFLPKSRIYEELIGTIEHAIELIETDYSYSNLIDCLDYHEFQFTLDNDPKVIGPVVNLMQQMAAGLQPMDDVTRSRIGAALEQSLHNAIFRGNLGLCREEQLADEEIQVDGELSLAQRRQKEAPYCDRKVVFRARLGKQDLQFKVHDEGEGFDTFQVPAAQDSNKLDIHGGRGLVLIHTFMDTVQFNDRGNEIMMMVRTKPLADQSA